MKARIAFLIVVLTFLLMVMLSACVPKSAADPVPPEIVYGQDMCDGCGMLIDEPRFAAAFILENDETRKFDDTAEMFSYARDHPEETIRAWFVHDYITEEWINGEAAFYVIANDLTTPMGSGLVAFASRDSAETFASENGEDVMTFDQAREALSMEMNMGSN